MPFLSSSDIQNVLLSRDANLSLSNSNNILVFVDTTAQQLLNKDNSVPLCRELNSEKDKTLAPWLDFETNTTYYKLTLILPDNTFPDSNNQYWISYDSGVTFIQVTMLKYEYRNTGDFFWIYFKQNNITTN